MAATQGSVRTADNCRMTTTPTQYSLTLDKSRVADFTDYLALDGVTLSFDLRDLTSLNADRERAHELAGQGQPSVLNVTGPDVEFAGLGGLHELKVDTVTIDGRGRIVIRAEVRHGQGEGVEVAVNLSELEAAASR